MSAAPAGGRADVASLKRPRSVALWRALWLRHGHARARGRGGRGEAPPWAGCVHVFESARRHRRADAPRHGADFKTYPEPRKSAKGMMLAEVKLLMEDKISGDREKGEETPTTKTKCVLVAVQSHGCCAARAARRRFGAYCYALRSAAASWRASQSLTRPCDPGWCRSVFQKTYSYVTRFSYPNATVDTAQSIRECAQPQP